MQCATNGIPVPTATELPPERVLQMLCIEQLTPKGPMKHSHYFKPVSGLSHIDVYRVLDLFKVTDPCIGHAVKKLLVAGGRGAGKDVNKDIQEAIDCLERWKEMRSEDAQRLPSLPSVVPPMASLEPHAHIPADTRPSGWPAPSSIVDSD